ncbi:MAG: signal peptidase II [Candidatus Melainabacteria bacterium]|nr:signal peptidase II [Candidatus Melainabacteria bacterium]
MPDAEPKEEPKQVVHTGRLYQLFTVVISAVIAFSLDRVAKLWALSHLIFGEDSVFWPGILQFRLTNNTGAAFSLGRDHAPLMTIIATVYTIVFICWALNRLLKASAFAALERVGVGLIIGGACGNLYERYSQGCVTDFIEFAFINFPIFNVADALIDVGLVLIFVDILFLHKHKDGGKPADAQ